MKWASATPRRASPRSASAAAWVSPCASRATEVKRDQKGRQRMARIAIVTGGTRGIGAAISRALKQEGYRVIANYAGNDEAAQKFKSETGIDVRKWDVSDYAACESNLKAIENEIGPI